MIGNNEEKHKMTTRPSREPLILNTDYSNVYHHLANDSDGISAEDVKALVLAANTPDQKRDLARITHWVTGYLNVSPDYNNSWCGSSGVPRWNADAVTAIQNDVRLLGQVRVPKVALSCQDDVCEKSCDDLLDLYYLIHQGGDKSYVIGLTEDQPFHTPAPFYLSSSYFQVIEHPGKEASEIQWSPETDMKTHVPMQLIASTR
jgi:hypothetical protein